MGYMCARAVLRVICSALRLFFKRHHVGIPPDFDKQLNMEMEKDLLEGALVFAKALWFVPTFRDRPEYSVMALSPAARFRFCFLAKRTLAKWV